MTKENITYYEEYKCYEFTYYDTNDIYRHDMYVLKQSELQSKVDELETSNCTHISIFDGDNDTIIYDDGVFF